MKNIRSYVVAAIAVAVTAGNAWADDLIIGTRALPTSMDPHFHNTQVNVQITNHVFDPLVGQDHNQQLTPRLAMSWKPLDDTTWEFKLRRGVKFQDGTPFTADDVLFTFERAPNVPNSPSGFGLYIKGKKLVKVDDHTFRITTESPYPLTPHDLARFGIVSRKNGDGATTADYNAGKATIGTGPYKFVEWMRGDRMVLEANPDYWGGKAKWDKVTLKPIKAGPSRIAALLNGDVDVIDNVPTVDVASLRKNPNLVVSQGPSNRIIFLNVDSNRDITPNVTTNDGKPMFPNPLRKWEVRKAISMAIDRKAIQERVMEGLSVPTGQLVTDGFFAYDPNLKVEPYDPEGAKKLLAKVGLADGFHLTISGPNDRYVNDAKIVETIAQMLTRIGIKTSVKTHPKSVYFTMGSNLEFSLSLFGNGAHTGGPFLTMKGVLHTYNNEAGYGRTNRGRYSNVRFDKLFEQAERTVDTAKRKQLMLEATRVVINDLGFIPIHHQVSTWATRKGLRYQARTDENTLAESVLKTN